MNRRYLILLLITAFVLIIIWQRYPQPLSVKLNKLTTSTMPHPSVGLLLKDLETGKTLYSKNSNQYFMPASNLKLLTAVAALIALGENFRFDTSLHLDPKTIALHHLKGDATLIFSGDPSLKTQDLITLFNTLKTKEIDTIEGDIVLDDSAFDKLTISPGSSWEDHNYCWGAPIEAATLNHNCVYVEVAPGLKKDAPVILTLPEIPQPVTFINHAITTKKDNKSCVIDLTRLKNNSIRISGCLPMASAKRTLSMANPKTHTGFKQSILYALAQNHISLNGKMYFTKAQNSIKTTAVFAIHHSKPLRILIKKMLKDSDNLVANTIFKTIGAHKYHQIGSFKNGAQAVHDILQTSLNIDIPVTSLADGSGESRYNFITPNNLIALLEHANKASFAQTLIDALPIAGIDGSLKSRLKSKLSKGKVFAKTGTMTGVTALSGYIKNNQNHLLAFSILINGFVSSPNDYKAIEDKICALVLAEKI